MRIGIKTFPVIVMLAGTALATGDDLSSLCADRTVIERVYYNHRLGNKPPFEQLLPAPLVESMVKQDQRKEAVLEKVYGVEITRALIETEIQHITTTTRAPDVLTELKAALGNDPARFASAVAKPILVERELRGRFENDDRLHAPQRREAERVREQLFAARSGSRGDEALTQRTEIRNQKSEIDQSLLTPAATNGLVEKLVAFLKQNHPHEVSETTWQLGARRAETNAPVAEEIELRKRFGPNAQILSSPHAGGKDQKFYFEDLPGELQRVLRVQLQKPGDVSAVIETPTAFLLFLATDKTDATLGVTSLTVPKHNFEQWLVQQTDIAQTTTSK